VCTARSRSGSEGARGGHLRPASLALCALAALALSALGPARADDPPKVAPEYLVKAAFLFRFTQYVEWPAATFESKETPLVIGVVGDDPFQGALERTVDGRTSQGRRVLVRQCRDAAEASRCHAVFVPGDGRSERAIAVLTALGGKPTLTVGDTPTFAEKGGVIGFALVDGHVRFVINSAAAKRSGLKVSSRLLELARSVIERGEGG